MKIKTYINKKLYKKLWPVFILIFILLLMWLYPKFSFELDSDTALATKDRMLSESDNIVMKK